MSSRAATSSSFGGAGTALAPRRQGEPLALLIAVLALLAAATLLAPATSARLLIVGCLAVLGLRIFWHRFDLALAAMLLATSSLIPRSRMTVPIGGGLRADAADLTSAALALFLLVQLLYGRRLFRLDRAALPIATTLLLFAGGAMASGAYARLHLHVNLGLVLGELRPAVYCAICAFVAAAAVRRGQLNGLIVALFLVADLTALAVILGQVSASVRGVLPAPPEGVWQINQQGSGGGFGAVRLVPPAHVLLYLMANIAFCLLIGAALRPRIRALLTVQLAFLVMALLLTFTRAQWIASLIALLLAALLAPRAAKQRLKRATLTALPVLCLLVAAIGAGVISPSAGPAAAIAARASSIFQPGQTLGTASLQWRRYEDGAAIASIRAHPLLGVGLGNNYRQRTLIQGEASGWLYPLDGNSSLTRFVHNGYLYLAVKTGLPVFACFIVFCAALLFCGVRLYLRMPASRQSLVTLACVCSVAGLLEWAYFEPHWMLAASMAAVGVAAGIVMAGGTPSRAAAATRASGLRR